MQYKFKVAKNKKHESVNKLTINNIKRQSTYAYKYDYIQISRILSKILMSSYLQH